MRLDCDGILKPMASILCVFPFYFFRCEDVALQVEYADDAAVVDGESRWVAALGEGGRASVAYDGAPGIGAE